MVETPVVKEISPSNEVVSQSLAWHDEFNRKSWQGKDSFHDREHVRATLTAAGRLIEAAQAGNDPLGILDDLRRWNEQHPETQISQDELPEVIKITFALHDTGNIAERVIKRNGKSLESVFYEHYKADNAESRSQEIAEKVIGASRLTEDQKRKFLSLVKHLINETKFALSGDVPFGVFARVVDQVGNAIFNENEKMVIGFLEEMRTEDPCAEFPPAFFFNFARRRFEQLVPEEKTRFSVLEIWGKELPEEKKGLEEELVTIADWLEERKK